MAEPSDEFEREQIPIEYVKTGYTLLVDRDHLARVTAVRQQWNQDGGRYTLTFDPADGGAEVLEVPAGGHVVGVYQKGRRPAAFPPRG